MLCFNFPEAQISFKYILFDEEHTSDFFQEAEHQSS